MSNLPPPPVMGEVSHDPPVIVMSTSEGGAIKDKLSTSFMLDYAAGAGYKLLTVIDGLADAYFLSQGTTYKWDTCAPQAVLLSQRGGVINYQDALKVITECDSSDDDAVLAKLQGCNLLYHEPDSSALPADKKWSNSKGLIAYLDTKVLLSILRSL